MPIPPHTVGGVLPAFRGADPTIPGERAPYAVTLAEIVARFGTSDARRTILRGFLRYRAALRNELGMREGFQWLDGSFIDRMPREPRDLDVVTLFFSPSSWTEDVQKQLRETKGHLLNRAAVKEAFLCDAYFVHLNNADTRGLPGQIAYWYGLFSHQRETLIWRGMLQVDLAAPDGDEGALGILEQMTSNALEEQQAAEQGGQGT